MTIVNHGARLMCVLAWAAGVLAADAYAQARPPTDAALGQLIERLTDRRSDDLIPERRPDGSIAVDLQGRFQQAPLAQFIDDDVALVQCVSSVEEADVFFGRNLRSGAPLTPAQTAQHAALVEAARRHGMSVPEYQFYGDLFAQSPPAQQALAGATLTIVNNDGAGEGFNSTAPQLLPAPGNDANANLGAQRLALFNAAAAVWGAFLDSSVTIEVRSQFESLACSNGGGVLGSAGAVYVHSDFPNAEFTDTFYHAALANKQAGADPSPNPDINATFNSDVDTGCLGAGTHFYYGLDNATPAGTINLFVVLLHEMGHGLGSSSFTNDMGQYLRNTPDIWARFQYDATLGQTWFQMSIPQRGTSGTNTGNLYWNGANVRNASGFLSAGRDAASGRVQLYAPNPYEGGSSVSHYSNAAAPNLLMEPFINGGLPLTLDLTRQQMRDIGWYRDTGNDLVPDTISNVLPSGGTLAIGFPQAITWTNTGGFAQNVSIELSLDGGGTWPIVVAADIANTGAYAWVVPDTPTSQGRLRVREHDFLAPLGQSAANFAIGSGGNTAPGFTPASAKSRQQGSPAGAAVMVGTVSDAQTPAGNLNVNPVAGGSATGITVGSLSNSNGTVTTTLAAGCTATSGTVRFEVSDGDLSSTGDLQVNVSANGAPLLGYANQAVAGGGATAINPLMGPGDNGAVISIVVHDAGTYSGTVSVNAAGVVSISNAQPVGVHTLTIRATDNCGAVTDATFQLTVENTAPTFTPAAAKLRQQGSPAGAAVVVGTVSDAQTAAGALSVTPVAGGSATGISVGTIGNSNGTITATLAAGCAATSGTVRFAVSDGALAGSGDLQMNVNPDTAPTLGQYTNAEVALGQAVLVTPDAAPADNGSVEGISAAVAPVTFAGTVNAELASGEVSVSQAGPAGAYTVTVTITDNCGTTTDRNVSLDVLGSDVFQDGFETP
jgi:hypothetical protein